MVDDSRTQFENDSVGSYNFFVCFGTDGNIIPRQKKQIEKLLASGVPKWAITIYIGPEDCEIPYSVDELVKIGALEEPKELIQTTEPRLCQAKFYEECPTTAITDTVYTAGVFGAGFWGLSETSLNGRKDFSKGHIELQIRDRFDLTDFAEITYQAKEVIAQQFGEETLKLHYALAAIAFRKEAPWIDDITVSVSKLLADFGNDKKKNRYISESSNKEFSQSERYITKEERLKQLAHQARLLKRIEVWVPEWRANKKRTFTVEMSNLWDIFSINEVTQLATDREKKSLILKSPIDLVSGFENSLAINIYGTLDISPMKH